MSDTLKAREAAIAAETRIEELFEDVLDTLHRHNKALVELHDAIRAAQPVSSGSVCLELYPCGPGCTGCPHPRWVKYVWTRPKDGSDGVLRSYNLDALEKDPVLALQRKTSHYKDTVRLVREAKTILGERSRLLALIRPLRHAAKSDKA